MRLSPQVLRWAVAAISLVVVAYLLGRTPPPPIELTFFYSPDAADVLTGPIERFNEEHDGIRVVADDKSSGTVERGIVEGELEPELWMPAASTWGLLLNRHLGFDVVPSENPSYFWSPEVFGIWGSVREHLGPSVSWSDLERLSKNDDILGEAGPFRFGHTKPTSSTSGLFAMASIYEAAGSTDAPGAARQAVIDGVSTFEGSVRHYGDIAEDWCPPLRTERTALVSAVYMQETTLLTECQDVEGFQRAYPQEGVYAADYPFIVFDADWVTPQEREAALEFRAWMETNITSESIAAQCLRVGTPADGAGEPCGGDPDAGIVAEEPPGADLLDAVQTGWSTTTRKPANVMIVLENSTEMSGPGHYSAALEMLTELVTILEAEHMIEMGLVTFADEVVDVVEPGPLPQVEDELLAALDPQTNDPVQSADAKLYDALAQVSDEPWMLAEGTIDLMVVVSTGVDDGSSEDLGSILDRLEELRLPVSPLQVFAVRVGDSQDGLEKLDAVADASIGQLKTLTTSDVESDEALDPSKMAEQIAGLV